MTQQQPVADADNQAGDTRGSDHAELDRLVRGIGQVCVSASALEAHLAFLCLTLDDWTDEKYRNVLSSTGQALREYRDLVSRLEAFGLGPDPRTLLEEATKLLQARNRVVHSVMMIDMKGASEPVYEAWHAKADVTWEVDPAALRELAENLSQLCAEAEGFGLAWEERAERDGWPVLPAAS